ncbi:unnamed protein product [Phytomonas sp. EM1]|nr:unnamed protein product [Phytomonas sp. EM1]|eukprot:CCW64811.1 unnamed protein product [Phytomonas sp. isolate EM1]
MKRPSYCRRIHGKIKRSLNIDGTALYRVEETSCDCPPPPSFPLRQPRVVLTKGRSETTLNRPANQSEMWSPARTIKDSGGRSYSAQSLPYSLPNIVAIAPEVDPENVDRSTYPLPVQELAIPTIPVDIPPSAAFAVRNAVESSERLVDDRMASPALDCNVPMPSRLEYLTTPEGVVKADGISHLIPASPSHAQNPTTQAACWSFCPHCGARVGSEAATAAFHSSSYAQENGSPQSCAHVGTNLLRPRPPAAVPVPPPTAAGIQRKRPPLQALSLDTAALDLDVVNAVLDRMLDRAEEHGGMVVSPCGLPSCGMCDEAPHEADSAGKVAAAPSKCMESDDGVMRCGAMKAVHSDSGWWSGSAAVAIIHNHYFLN